MEQRREQHEGAAQDPTTPQRVHSECSPAKFAATVARLKESGARLLTMSASRRPDGEVVLQYFFDLEGVTHVLATKTRQRRIDSLFSYFANADFVEREVNSVLDVRFVGHPHLQRRKGADEGPA